MKKNRSNKKGFTLIELIVVVAIIAILATLLIPSFIDYVRRARKAAAIQEVKQIINCTTATMTQTVCEGKTLNLNKTFHSSANGSMEAGCITNWSIANYVSGITQPDDGREFDRLTSGAIINALGDGIAGSMDSFSGDIHNPIGDKCSTFYNRYKCPGLIFCYDKNGAILMIEYYNHDVLVHYERGEYTVTFAGDTPEPQFSGYSKITY